MPGRPVRNRRPPLAPLGMIFTHDSTLPRARTAIGVWVKTLAGFLEARTSDHALRNRIHHLG